MNILGLLLNQYVPGLITLIDPSTLALVNDDPIPTITSQDPQSLVYSQATEGNRPLYKTGGPNGHPYIDSSAGITHELTNAVDVALLPTARSPFTVAVIQKWATAVEFASAFGRGAHNGAGTIVTRVHEGYLEMAAPDTTYLLAVPYLGMTSDGTAWTTMFMAADPATLGSVEIRDNRTVTGRVALDVITPGPSTASITADPLHVLRGTGPTALLAVWGRKLRLSEIITLEGIFADYAGLA